MEVKAVLVHVKKNFDRIILVAIILVLIIFSLKYIGLLKKRPGPFGEKELYDLVGAPWRVRADTRDENVFREMIEKKVHFVIGIKPAIFYKKLIHRNPFVLLKDLVIKPPSLKPSNAKIYVGKSVAFQILNAIGPYKWECEPKNLGSFKDNVFKATTRGRGRIIATDARGHKAMARLRIMTKGRTVAPPPPPPKVLFKYGGAMTIHTTEGKETLASIEDLRTKKFYFKKVGEKINGFTVKDITTDTLILMDEKKGEEIKLNCE